MTATIWLFWASTVISASGEINIADDKHRPQIIDHVQNRPVFQLHTNSRMFILLSIGKKDFSFLHIQQKAGRHKMCSASDAQIVKNVRRSAALWTFLAALQCASTQPAQSVGCSHYEFLLHPLTGWRGGEPTGNFSAIQTHNRPSSMGALPFSSA